MDREEAERRAYREYARRQVLHIAAGIPLTWAVIFLLWAGTFGLLILASGRGTPDRVELVLATGLFLATVLTPLFSLEPFAGSLHSIAAYRRLQRYLAGQEGRRRG